MNIDDLSLEQRAAIALCVDTVTRVASVTGGAGTGKTTILRFAYDDLKRVRTPVLVAPTGRAAKRIQEATGIPARTIHRLLEFPMPDDGDLDPTEPKRNRGNPILYNTVFVDETSMLGPTLYNQLLDALPNKGIIRFFGDNNQLRPVEAGEPPFKELLATKPKQELTYNYRSDDAILSNALRILRGSAPIRNERFEIIYSPDPIKYMNGFITEDFAREDHQIIMPARRGKYGTNHVNVSLQVKLNPTGPYLRLERFKERDKELAPLLVRVNDKAIWIKNDYQLGLYNGEIGTISSLDDESGDLHFATPDDNIHVPPRLKIYNPFLRTLINYDPRKQIELGYAISTHKAQGSEFDTVVYCAVGGMAFLLNRANFYTAITRAKRRVILLLDSVAMRRLLQKPRED